MTARNQNHRKQNRTAGEEPLLPFILQSRPRVPGLTEYPGYAAGVKMTQKPPTGPAETGHHLGRAHPNRPARTDPTVDTTSRQVASRAGVPLSPPLLFLISFLNYCEASCLLLPPYP